MTPLIISTMPQNGSTDVDLNSNIRIQFSNNILDPVSAKIQISNINNNSNIDASILFNSEKPDEFEISFIDPSHLPGNKRCGLTNYRITIRDIRDGDDGSKMSSTYALEFITEEEDIIDAIQASNSLIVPIGTLPSNGDKYVSVEYVRIKYSQEVFAGPNLKVTLIPDSMDKIDFIDLLEIQEVGGVTTISNQILSFKPNGGFLPNKTYSIRVSGLVNSQAEVPDYQLEFTTKRSPYFGEENDLTNSEYDFMKEITHGNTVYVSNMIFSNSVRAQKIATDASTYSSIDWAKAPDYIYEYVAAKTKYDIIYKEYLRLTTNANRKTLGDLEISYTYTISDLYKILATLKTAYEKSEAEIKGTTSAASKTVIFQKGSSKDTIPGFMNRGLKDLNGGKSW